MGVTEAEFYDQTRIAIVPMAFCFPGYDAKGADLPPPKLCAQTWHARVMAALGEIPLTLLVGGYAHRWHLGVRDGVTAAVAPGATGRQRFSRSPIPPGATTPG